jgi:Ino eighty subunit 1
MIILLTNATNFLVFPEMRAQLRTYHAIPSLQAHQDPHAYKQLQDAPRLKSILKGGAEDREELNTLEKIKQSDVPRTNPVNLLFVICQSAAKIAELHFPPGREFHDLVMRTNFTSQSRARAFLWIMWFYLESDFTEEGCDENPFGPGVDYGVDVANQGVPRMEEMPPEQEAKENVDSQEELDFGLAKQKMRAKIIAADQQYMADNQSKRGGRGGRLFPAGDEGGPTTGILPRIRPSKHESDIDSVRSTPPPRALGGRQSGALGSTSRRGPAALKYHIIEGSSPAGGQVIEGIVPRKPRPPTAHQLAVERNRSQRVEYILDRGIRKRHHKSRKLRKADGAIIRALNRLKELPDPFDDSEGDDFVSSNRQLLNGYTGDLNKGYPFRERGFAGLCLLNSEEDDYGEQVASYAAALRRANRRFRRWEGHEGPELGVIPATKKRKLNGVVNGDDEDAMEGEGSPTKEPIDPAETEDEAELLLRRTASRRPRAKTNGARRRTNRDADVEEHDELDEVDKELLGEVEVEVDEADAEATAEKDQDEEELDDVDKTLLGMDGESDSD